MGELAVWRTKLQEIYAKRTTLIDKGIQFLLSLCAFLLINRNLGTFSMITSPLISLGLAVVCTFLPMIFAVLAAGVMLLLHFYAVSMGVAIVGALVCLVMFCFYIRFTPKKAVLILLVPLAFWLKIPYVIPVACGLAMTPVAAVPVSFGTVIYFMTEQAQDAASILKKADGTGGVIAAFTKAVFADPTLWLTIFASVLCILVVYTIRRSEMDHAWKIAIGAGAVLQILILFLGGFFLDLDLSYLMLLLGNVAAVAIGALLEYFLFSVDYAKSEFLEYEDDEYFYYVKAIPKIGDELEKKPKKMPRPAGMEDEYEEIRVTPRRPSKAKNTSVRRAPSDTLAERKTTERPSRQKREKTTQSLKQPSTKQSTQQTNAHKEEQTES